MSRPAQLLRDPASTRALASGPFGLPSWATLLAVVCLAVCAGWTLLAQPLHRASVRADAELAAVRRKLERTPEEHRSSDAAFALASQLREQASALDAWWHVESGARRFDLFHAVGREVGIQIRGIEPRAVPATAQPARREKKRPGGEPDTTPEPPELRAEAWSIEAGGQYADLVRFMDRVLAGPGVVRVDSVRLQPQAEDVTMLLGITVFSMSEPITGRRAGELSPPVAPAEEGTP